MPVKVFTTEGCQPCKATKKKLTKEGIKYEEVSLDGNEEAKAQVKALGYGSAPVVISDDDHWAGFQPDKILALKAASA